VAVEPSCVAWRLLDQQRQERAGLDSAARHHGDEAVRLLRRLKLDADADRILGLTRGEAPVAGQLSKHPLPFDCPTFWAAFQLVGRVT
jgi:hypothetical protein